MNDFPGDDVAALGKFVNDTSDMCLQSHEKFQEDHQNITWEGNKFSE